MPYKLHNNYHIPTTKKDLIKSLRDYWKGKGYRMTDLSEMSIKRLRGVFKTVREETIMELMMREDA